MNDIGPGTLFVSAFVSSTLLPGGSEALFVASLWQGVHAPWWLLAAATTGNTLGGMTSWGIGRVLAWRRPVQSLAKPEHRKAVERVRRYGAVALLFSWLPVIGDPLCLAAGWLRMHWLPSLALIACGKGARYAVLLAAA
ncbi:MAG: YqaA family protein [Thiohalomonadaceae bacterium]